MRNADLCFDFPSHGTPSRGQFATLLSTIFKSESRDVVNSERDILRSWQANAVIYWLPIIVLVAIGFVDVGSLWRSVIWATALTVMGSACVANAVRCGRVHCYVTGPFFLLLAVVSLLYGFGLIPLGREGWNVIALVAIVGAAVLFWLPECVFGKYRAGRDS
jgi:hypothetical protein